MRRFHPFNYITHLCLDSFFHTIVIYIMYNIHLASPPSPLIYSAGLTKSLTLALSLLFCSIYCIHTSFVCVCVVFADCILSSVAYIYIYVCSSCRTPVCVSNRHAVLNHLMRIPYMYLLYCIYINSDIDFPIVCTKPQIDNS